MSSLSLKSRLSLAFSLLVLLVVAFSVLLLFEQHQIAVRGTEIAIRTHQQVTQIAHLREVLAEADRQARGGELPDVELGRFRAGVRAMRAEARTRGEPAGDAELEKLLDRLEQHFDLYVQSLQRPRNSARSGTAPAVFPRGGYEDLVAQVGALTGFSESRTYRDANLLKDQQRVSMQIAMSMLGVFILLMAVGGYKVISIITEPLSALVRFLDGVHVEDDLPTELPHFRAHIPEISSVARSFEELLGRLRGYRMLNVRRLLLEKRRADIIAASISDGIFLLRGEEIIYMNPVAERILGLVSPGGGNGVQGRGLSLRELSEKPTGPPASGPEFDRQKRMARSCARSVLAAVSQTMPVEYTFEEGDEDRKSYYLIQAHPISYDLIEQVEHEVKGAVEQLLDRFQANTLVVAQDVTLVRESQDAKGHFLGTLSHEIKTPVTSLTMATRLLQKFIDQIPNPTHRSLIMTCVEDVDRLRKLLDDLLTISRFDTLTQRLAIQNIDLIKLVKHSVQSFQVSASERGVTLTATVQNMDKSVTVPMDPTKVSWAISNLLINALRHTPKGGRVEAQLEMVQDWVELRIRDTGPGIERKRQSRIFDKFSPYYDIRVARSGSAGAGLSIAREIIVAHGGRIWVTSEPGQGAQFCFTLPLKRSMSEPMEGFLKRPPPRSAGEPGEQSVTEELEKDGSSMKGAYSDASARS